MSYMKKPCEHCPYRKDVKPFLTPERGEELAYHTENPYNTFPCHKTTTSIDEIYDDYSEDQEGEMMCTEKSKECAGFLTMQIQANGEQHCPEGFKPAYGLVYEDSYEMSEAYEDPKIWKDIYKDFKRFNKIKDK